MTRRYLFVIPDAQATISGGNLYNLGLTSALRAAGVDVRVVDRESVLRDAGSELCFVDSLYLDDVARLAPCYLMAHYLPSLVASAEPSPPERAALAAAEGFLVTSDFMAGALGQLVQKPRPTLVVPPAIDGAGAAPADAQAARELVRAVIVANLVPGKGVLPFLDALAPHLRGGAGLELIVIGNLERDPAYAAACQTRAAGVKVQFLGPLSHCATLGQIAASDFFISSSRMESFGMALAEARALGVPIVARAAGNTAAHVDESAGGRLLDSDEALAAECVRLAHDPAELARRHGAASAVRPPARSWADAARDFLAAVTGSSPRG